MTHVHKHPRHTDQECDCTEVQMTQKSASRCPHTEAGACTFCFEELQAKLDRQIGANEVLAARVNSAQARLKKYEEALKLINEEGFDTSSRAGRIATAALENPEKKKD